MSNKYILDSTDDIKKSLEFLLKTKIQYINIISQLNINIKELGEELRSRDINFVH